MLDLIKDKSKIDKYIQSMYSRESKLNQTTDLQERQIQACSIAGLTITNLDVQEMINLKNEGTNELIFNFLSKENPNEYIMLISDQHLFLEIQRKKMLPLKDSIDDDEMLKNLNLKTAMSAKSEEILERINRMLKVIYKTENEINLASNIIKLKSPEQRIKKTA